MNTQFISKLIPQQSAYLFKVNQIKLFKLLELLCLTLNLKEFNKFSILQKELNKSIN